MLKINGRFYTQKTTGVQRFARELSSRLTLDHEFLVPNHVLDSSDLKPIPHRFVGKKYGHLWEQFELRRSLKKSDLLLNLCNTGPAFLNNQIVTIHDLAFLHKPEWFSKGFQIYYSNLLSHIAKRSRAICTVSEFSKSEILKYFQVPEDKVHVLYNGVDLSRFTPGKTNEAEPYLLSVSSLDPRKNFVGLIKAFLAANLEGVKLKIVGDRHANFSNNSELEELLKNPLVEFTGRVSDDELIALYQGASLFVFGSLYEGFGITPMEALATETPILVSDIPVFREVYGDLAEYAPPEDSQAFGERIREVFAQKKQANPQLLHSKLSQFKWELSAKKLEALVQAHL